MFECAYCRAPFSGAGLFCCQSCELLSNWMTAGSSPLKANRFTSQKWQKFNVPELQSQFDYSALPIYRKYRFYVEGLQCSSCVHLLEDFPLYCDGVIESRIDFSKRILEVETKKSFGLGDVCEAIEQLGYIPTPLKEANDYEKAQQKENVADLKRIGVAAAVAGNSMLFSIPLYAGLQGALAINFKWIMFFLFLPLLGYSAIPFYKKAWTGLLTRRVSVDMMIVVALWAGFVFSTYSLVTGTDELYFDSTASFIFLILLTRYALKYQQDKLIPKNILTDLFINEIYRAENGKNLVFGTIEANQAFNLKEKQLLPCDSTLSSESAEFDMAFLTGESFPQLRHKGDVILAGSRLLSPGVLMTANSTALGSQLAQSLDKIDLERKTKNKIQSISDVVSHRLTLTVFFLAGLFFVMTYQELGVEAFKRCLALITIACPCAVAFGTPLAHALGLRKANQNGFCIKSSSVFEKINQVKKIIFDKTGTLTSSQLMLKKTFPEEISPAVKAIILGLEKSSLHPIALGLRQAWLDAPTANIRNVNEIKGQGVEGIFESHTYKLLKSVSDQDRNEMQADFFVDGKVVAYLFFEETILPEARAVIADFNQMDFDVMMLSGDKRSRAIEASKKLGIRPAFVFAEQSAESKKEIIAKNNPCLFVGDGLNDLEALSEAHVGFAIRGTFDSTLAVSDIYAPQKDLNSLLEIIHLSKKIQQTVKANLLFAIFYNTLGGIFALLGFINPLAAAVLMPVSSFFITAHTVWRLK